MSQNISTITLPIIRQVFTKTIGSNLVSVKPMSQPMGSLAYMDFNYLRKVFFTSNDLYKMFLTKLKIYRVFYVKVKKGQFNKCVIQSVNEENGHDWFGEDKIRYDLYAKNGNKFHYYLAAKRLYMDWIGNRLHFETEMKLGRHTDRKYNSATKKWEWKYENQSKYTPVCY